MNKDIKDLWVATLRRGEYKQGKFMFRDLDDNFDAVGVLMDLAASAGVIDKPKKYTKETGATQFFGWTYDRSATRITKTVYEWAGIGYYTANHIQTMNDHGKNFNTIADYIEEEL